MIPPTRRVRSSRGKGRDSGGGTSSIFNLWVSHDGTLQDLDKVRQRVLQYPTRYQVLNFFMVEFNDEIIDSLLGLQNMNFDSITLFSCKGKVDDALAILCSETPRVSKISLDCLDFSAQASTCLLNAFAKHDNLRSLSITGSYLSSHLAECLMHGLEMTSRLESFCWKYQGIVSHRSFARLLKGLHCNTSLQRLEVACNGIGDDGIKYLLRSISHHMRLKKLVLYVENMAYVVKSLRSTFKRGLPRLKSVRIHTTGAFDASCLITNRLPRSISYTFLPDIVQLDRMDMLGRALLANPTIRRLDLSLTGIDDDAIVEFSKWLRRINGLKSLKLRGNKFGERGATALLEALRGNVTIELLELPSGCPHFFDLQYMVELNRAGRRLLMQDERSIPHHLWPTVLERAQRISYAMDSPRLQTVNAARRANALFFLLHGPVLLEQQAF